MSTFHEREQGFENKFAHEQKLRFKAAARRNKMLGLWAARKMGLSGTIADTYASDVVASKFQEGCDEDVARKLRKDFESKNVAQSDQQIRATMADLMSLAVEQITAGN